MGQALAVLASACALSACGADDPYGKGVDARPGFDAAARQELLDLGVGKYLGAFTPDRAVSSGNETIFEFDPKPHFAPICYTGKPFEVSVRDTGSRNLLIYLQGGGACWSALCSANKQGGVGVPSLVGWTSDAIANNPLRDYNVVYIGYCDASVFSGDNDVPDTKNGGPDGIRHHHGLANLSAGVDIARAYFPNPDKLVLAGSSAGGYGTLIGTEVVRLAYPHTPFYVINDAGVGLATPSILEAAKTEWKFEQFIPASCKACDHGQANQQITPMIGWALAHDPGLRVGAYSSYHDFVIGGVFLQMDTNDFKALLLKETGAIHDQFPDRFERFLVAGSMHTGVLEYPNQKIDGVTLGEWTQRMVDNSYDWPDLLAKDQ